MLFNLQVFSGGIYPPSLTSRTISFSISNSFWHQFDSFFRWEEGWCSRKFDRLFRASIPCHAIWQKQNEERELFRRAQRLWQRKVWTQYPSRGEKLGCTFFARKMQKSSPRCKFLARKGAKFIANFSATKSTSLPSHSLSLSVSLSLSHRAHLTHNIGSAFALPIIKIKIKIKIFRTKSGLDA